MLSDGHRNLAADALGPRQDAVRIQHRRDAGLDVGWKSCDLPRRHVDVKGDVLRRRRDPAFGRMPQFLEGVDALFIRREHPDRDLHGVAEMDLAQVAYMGFRGETRAVALLQIVWADAEM